MIGDLLKRYLRHWRDETGSAAVEFALVFPVMAAMITMTLEMGFITLRQTMIERGLDMAVREVRLGTGAVPDHDEVKELVCENAIFMKECSEKLFLEMDASDARAFVPLHPVASCTDEEVPEDIRPARVFNPGQPNEIVMVRACLKYEPLFPKGMLGGLLHTDMAGEAAIIAVTAFVQEPR